MVADEKKDQKIQRVNLNFEFGIKGKVEIKIGFTVRHVVKGLELGFEVRE